MDLLTDRKPKRKSRLPWKFILIVLAIAVIVAGGFLLHLIQSKQQRHEDFPNALAERDYEKALELYRGVQDEATSPQTKPEKKLEYRRLQSEYEALVERRISEITSNLLAGGNLAEEDRAFIEGMEEVSAAALLPILNRETENWLDGKSDHDRWYHFIYAFKDIPSLDVTVRGLIEQEDQLQVAAQLFAEAIAIEQGDDWEKAWRTWNDLTTNEEIGRFARTHADFRLKKYEDEQYLSLLEQADQLIESHKYYTGKNLLERMFDLFPNSQEVLDRLNTCVDRLPRNLEVWEDMVEVISVKPLMQDANRAMESSYKNYASQALLAVDEYRNLLQELYDHGYVLVSAERFAVYPDYYPKIVVPEGKKPLVMIFEDWHYSPANQQCTTIGKLMFDAEKDQFYGKRILRSGEEETLYGSDAVSILEEFIDQHPDFSFDGARGVLAIIPEHSVLGYRVTERQLDDSTPTHGPLITVKRSYKSDQTGTQTAPAGDKPDGPDDERVQLLREEDLALRELCGALKRHGWVFACGGYSGEDLGIMKTADLTAEIDAWLDTVEPYTDKTNMLCFPAGSHVYANAASLDALLERDFTCFMGIGPRVYNYYDYRYVHLDRKPINGYTLKSPEQWNLDILMNPWNVLNPAYR